MSLVLEQRLQKLDGPILVTGHTGFKGTWLTLLLESLGVPVVGLALEPADDSLYVRTNRKGKIPEEYMDIRDYDKVEKFLSKFRPSAIIHMAAQPLVLESYIKPRETFDVNVMGTLTILECAVKTSSVKAILVVTTDKVYRNYDLSVEFVESDPLEGKDPYSASKVAAESVVNAWQKMVHLQGGPKIVSVRAGNVIGGGDWSNNRLLPDLLKASVQQKQVIVRNPQSSRPWQHVLDPLTGYLKLLDKIIMSNFATQSMNFGPEGESLTVAQVLRIFTENWPQKIDISIGTEESDLESKTLMLNSNLAKNILKWKPHWSQRDAVLSTIDWWRRVEIEGEEALDVCKSDLAQILSSNR